MKELILKSHWCFCIVKTVGRFPVSAAAAKVCGLILLSYFVLATTSITTAVQSAQRRSSVVPSEAFKSRLPTGISKTLWRQRIPSNNPMTPAKVSLGRALYFDKRLSSDGTVSCATCHDPANAFTDHTVIAIGASSRVGTRNAPTILNAMFSEHLFWDGRVGSLEEQAKQPMSNPFEMGMGGDDAVVARVSAIPEYRQGFRHVFGHEGITIDTIVKAIAAYERTQLSGNSPFDRFISGDTNAITEAQKRGWEIFKGKAKCIECHSFSASSPFFTDFRFHNTGIAASDINFEQLTGLARQIADRKTSSSVTKPVNITTKRSASAQQSQHSAPLLAHIQGFTDLGRYLVTKQPKDIGAFKTPTLRDIELTTPYMHNGSEKTLIDVVRFYNRGGNRSANLDERLHPLNLSDKEMNGLVEFMRTLTSDDVLRQSQSSKPQSRTAVIVGPLKATWKKRRR
ncbi:MAG TPA: cytochrome c peroxidase [Pyrinomonadaceae bacterium]|nr:cytochrome c peroxidase [Pyrinomonadaceae bacterium]